MNDDMNTKKTVELKAQNTASNPVIMTADIYGFSFATFFHTDTGVVDISLTPNVVDGTFARGLQIGPEGLNLIYDGSPKFVATLDCKR